MLLMRDSKHKTTILAVFGVVLFLGIGIAIPKLTVHDTVPADADRSCIDSGIKSQRENSLLKRLLFATGAFQVTKAERGGGEAKFYTLFRIPLGTAVRTICDYATNEYKSDQLGISFNYPIDYVLSEGNGEGGGAVESYFIGLAPRPAPAPELPPGVQVDLEPIPGIGFAFYRNPDSTETPEAWIHDQMTYRAGEGNFQDPTLHSITVDGVPAVRYLDTSGLYQRDTVLFRHGDWMVQIAADDATYFKSDFEAILGSIKSAPVSFWKDTNIKCLPHGHTNVSEHSHATLDIVVNGKQEEMPANIGISPTCMAEVHTHESGSEIHIETVEAGAQFTLGDLYLVWRQEIYRPGFGLNVFVDGEKVWGPVVDDMRVGSPEDIILKDGQMIRLEYASKG